MFISVFLTSSKTKLLLFEIVSNWLLDDGILYPAGYNIPSSSNQFDTISNNNNFVLDEVRKTEININSNRVTSFFQFSKDYKNLSLTAVKERFL